MEKNFVSSDQKIRVELPEATLTPVIGQEKLLAIGNELKIYHYLAGKPDELLAKWIVTDNNIAVTARQWVDKFEVGVAAAVWNEEERIRENSILMVNIDAFSDLPF